MSDHCPSRVATRTEYGDPYWPTCQDPIGHEGDHHSGHYQDVMWVWSDDEAMTPEEVAAWRAR